MAVSKLSEIASGSAAAGATDVYVAVRSGTTDVLVTGVYLDLAQSWTAAQTFAASGIKLTGVNNTTTFASLAATSGKTVTFPNSTGTVALLSTANAFTNTNSIAVADADAFDVGPNGTTNPTLEVDTSTASAATGLKIKSAAAAAGLALSVISSGTNENLTIDAKGSGTFTVAGTSTGNFIARAVTIGPTTLSGSSTTSNWLNVTGTLPTTLSAQVNGVNLQMTSAGSSAQAVTGLRADLLAGYTGSSYTTGVVTNNLCAGTGTSLVGGAANYGFFAQTTPTTTGSNHGGYFHAEGGNFNVGTSGQCTVNKNSATNVGVLGLALNAGSSPVHVGGFFGLMTAAPTFASAALMADNGSTTSDVCVLRDNGTAFWTAADGGTVIHSPTATGTIGYVLKRPASPTVAALQIQTSAGASLGSVGGTIFDHFADAATTSTDGTFDTLYTDTTVANTLSINGDKIEFDFTLTCATHTTNTAQIKLAFGGINILDSTAITIAAAATVRVSGYVIRKTSTTCRAMVEILFTGSSTLIGSSKAQYTPDSTLTGMTLSGTNILLLTAASAGTGAASGDIAAVTGYISALPAA